MKVRRKVVEPKRVITNGSQNLFINRLMQENRLLKKVLGDHAIAEILKAEREKEELQNSTVPASR